MNETDIKKCIKHGYCWTSWDCDEPEKKILAHICNGWRTSEFYHATKREAAIAIATRREDKRVAARKEAGTQVTPPETPEQRDARLRAYVEGCKAKGGPITKEQLTDEVCGWLSRNAELAYVAVDLNGEVLRAVCPMEASNVTPDKGVFWNEADAKHAMMLEDGKTQMTPITPEQAKMLRGTDTVFCLTGNLIERTRGMDAGAVKTAIWLIKTSHCTYYFTNDAAKAALDRQKLELAKAEHKFPEIPSWCPPLLKGDVPLGFGNTFKIDGKPHKEIHAINKDWDDNASWDCTKWAGNTDNLFYAAPRTSEIAKLNYPWLASGKTNDDTEPPKWCERTKGMHVQHADNVTYGSHDLQNKLEMSCSSTFNGWCFVTFASEWRDRLVGDNGLRARYHNPAHIEWEKRQAEKHANKPEMKPSVMPVEQPPCSSSSEMSEETITPTENNTAFGNKYHRTIKGVTEGSAVVDVYCVLEAFNVTCPARQHAIKKLLCAGLRGKGDSVQDLSEAMESVSRAIVLEKQRKE